AFAEREVRLRVDGALIGVELEGAPGGGEHDALDALDELLALHAVTDQVRDRAHLQAVGRAEPLELRAAGHLAVVAHDLADDSGGRAGGEARTSDGAFGLAGGNE